MLGRSLLIASLGLALAACGAPNSGESASPQQAPLVEVVAVASVSSAGAVRASGLVGYRREPQLAFTSAGVVGSIDVDVGDVVRRGQRLATLRRISVGANADEAALAQANAERDLARTQALFEAGFVSEARLEDARLAVERARGASILTAPANGVILRRVAEPAQTVAAGAPVLVFGETGSGLVVRAPVASADASRIRVTDAAIVRVSEAQSGEREGRVTRIGAKSDEATGAFEVEVEVSGAEGLRSGMVAEVEITASTAGATSPTLLVPTLSLLDARADQGIVFVVDERGVAHRRSVRTAGVTQAGVLVVEGLSQGEHVVAAGAAYVRDGEAVRRAAGS
jgi:RND family efflux transporter MFP subunit